MTDKSGSVRVVDWLASRMPASPPGLFEIIARNAGETTCAVRDLPFTLIDLGARILDGIGEDRDSANDLLAADSLISFAIEAAAEQSSDVESFSRDAAQRLAQIGAQR